MVEYPIVVYEPKCWTVYVHVVPKEIRSSPDRDDYYDKYYVGITSQPVVQRWGYKGYGYRKQIFSHPINKYGWDNIRHYIIATGLSKLFACEFEKYLIKKLKSWVKDNHGYNKTQGGEGFLGVQKFGDSNSFYGKHHSKEQIEKWSIERKNNTGSKNGFYNKHHTDDTKKLLSQLAKKRASEHPELYSNRPSPTEDMKKKIGILHSKPVYVFDINLNFIGEFHSVKEAADSLKITRRVAETIVNGKRKYDKDYVIKFKDQVDDIEEFRKSYIVNIKQ